MPKVIRNHQHQDFSALEEELRLARQSAEEEHSSQKRSQEEELLLIIAGVPPKEKKKSKKKGPSASVQKWLMRQQQERRVAAMQRADEAAVISAVSNIAEEKWERQNTAAPVPEAAILPEITEQAAAHMESAPAVLSEPAERSERDLLMEDPDMRYVIVKDTSQAHDRDCPELANIPDRFFRMTGRFPKERWFCEKCYHRALIRSCLPANQTDRLDLYCAAFEKLNAQSDSLRRFMLGCRPELYDVDSDRIFLRSERERWMLLAEGQQCQLYRIVSYEDGDTGRVYSRLSQDWFGSFDKIVFRISQYPISRERNRRLGTQRRMEARLASIANFRRLHCFSPLYQYYIYADCLNYHRALGWKWGFPIKALNIREYPDTQYTTVVCRIRRRDRMEFAEAMKEMKKKSRASDGNSYADFCEAYLPADDRQTLISVLRRGLQAYKKQ